MSHSDFMVDWLWLVARRLIRAQASLSSSPLASHATESNRNSVSCKLSARGENVCVVLTSSCFGIFSFASSHRSLKVECEKLASEKTEIQRHYVMVRAFSSSRRRFVVDFTFLASSTVSAFAAMWCYRLHANLTCFRSRKQIRVSEWAGVLQV